MCRSGSSGAPGEFVEAPGGVPLVDMRLSLLLLVGLVSARVDPVRCVAQSAAKTCYGLTLARGRTLTQRKKEDEGSTRRPPAKAPLLLSG